MFQFLQDRSGKETIVLYEHLGVEWGTKESYLAARGWGTRRKQGRVQ